MSYNDDDSNIIGFPSNNDDDSFNEDKLLHNLYKEVFGYIEESSNESDEKLLDPWELMIEANYERDPEIRRKYYDEALKMAPDDLEIRINYISATSELIDQFSQIEAVLDDYYQKHHNEIQEGYDLVENQPYFCMKEYLADMFLDACIYKKAEKHLADIVRDDINDALGVRYSLMALYIKYADYEKSKALFDKYNEFDDQMHLFMVTSAILSYKLDEADELIKELWKINPNVSIFFKSEVFYPEYFEYIEYNLDYYGMYGVRLLAEALLELSEFYVNSEFLYDYFRKQLVKIDLHNFTDAERFPELHDKACKLEGKGIFKGISRKYVFSLLIAGFETKEDLEDATRKEVLAVDGIGPATVKKLEANGIKFKK